MLVGSQTSSGVPGHAPYTPAACVAGSRSCAARWLRWPIDLENEEKEYNPVKLGGINDILEAYKGNFTELFISLANKYEIEDLSIFAGINFD